MYPVVEKNFLSSDTALLKIRAPHVAKAQPGQFVMLQLNPDSENIPIAILDTYEEGFTCLIKAVGRSTLEMLEEGDSFYYVGGPMGRPFPLENYGRVLAYAYGWGISPVINVAKHLREKGNAVDLVVVGEPVRGLLETYNALFDNVFYEEAPTQRGGYDLVYTAGSNELSKELSKMYPRVMAMVNVHMLDSVGLCLVCRVWVEGSQRLACVEGPWFWADKVDWENLISREDLYREQERLALEHYKRELARKKAKEVNDV